MKRRRMVVQPEEVVRWKWCPACTKLKPVVNGLTAGDGQRWYCSERCLDRAEKRLNAHAAQSRKESQSERQTDSENLQEPEAS